MSQQRAVLVLGSAGVGKSTLINRISGKSEATVSHQFLVDGTSELETVVDSTDAQLEYLDTPGLDSNNFSRSIGESVRQHHADYRFLVVLVLSNSAARATCYLAKFETLLDDLIGAKPFVIYWTGEGKASDQKVEEIKRKFPQAICLTDVAHERFKEVLADRTRFYELAGKPKINNVSPSLKIRAQPMPPIGLPKNFSKRYRSQSDANSIKADAIEPLVDAVLQVKERRDREWVRLKQMGDAQLKDMILQILYSNGEREHLETKMLLVTTANSDGSPMVRFFNQHIQRSYQAKFPTEDLAFRTKADFVEALLQIARERRNTSASIFIFKSLLNYIC
jgi:GTPase SAR1 family protein